MIHGLKIKTDTKLSKIRVQDFRNLVLSYLNDISKNDLDNILFHLNDEQLHDKKIRKVPYLLFGKPVGFEFYIFGYFEEGLRLLNIIKQNLRSTFVLSNKEITIKRVTFFEKNFIPKKSHKSIEYKTSTPVLAFNDKFSRKKVEGIIYNNNLSREERDNQLKSFTNECIIRTMKFTLGQLLNKSDNSFDSLNAIHINWSEFKVFVITDKDIKRFAVAGKFTSNWELPYFIGHRVGAGFGKITTVKKWLNPIY